MDLRTEKRVFGLFLVFFSSFQIGQGKRIGQSIYTDLNESAFCFRRTNGTHQMGCTSDPNGNVGVVHMIENESDKTWLIEKGPHNPYVAMITPKMFQRSTLLDLKNSGKLTGIILLGVNETFVEYDLKPPTSFSGDSKCPNSHSSLYSDGSVESCGANPNNPWNPFGSGILLEDWSFPIFLIDNPKSVQELILECYERNKPLLDEPREWPLCAVELKSHMTAAVDTKTCRRRNRLVNPFSPILICDPLGDQNVYHLNIGSDVDESKERFDDKSVLIVSARLDAINLFDKLESGFDSPSLGIVTLLAAVQILNQNEKFKVQEGKNVMFTFFNGESFDYIGSSRMMYDMQNNKFPEEISSSDEPKKQWPLIDIESISAHIELGQLFNTDKSNEIFAHIDSQFDDEDLLNLVKSEGNSRGLNVKDSSSEVLPPASVQTTLKVSNKSIPAIMLSNFDQSYTNNFYHSLYDTAKTFEYDHEDQNSDLVKHLAKISETVAKVVFEKVGDKSQTIQFNADTTLINDLIQCYTVSPQCELFASVSSADFVPMSRLPKKPLPQYVGVDRSQMYNTLFTYRLLGYLSSAKQPLDGAANYSLENCTAPENQSVYDYIFMSGTEPPPGFNGTMEDCRNTLGCGYCYNITAKLIKAVSPAFEIDNYDFHDDHTYSSWTESSWQTTSSRMFLKADPVRERGYLVLGIFMLLASFISVIWLDKFSLEIFANEVASGEQSQAAVSL